MLKTHKAIIGSRYYRITYFILPILFTVIGFLYRLTVPRVITELVWIVQAWLMMYEGATEYFGYGPIYRKNNLGMEYLKTSVSGMQLLQKSILTDSLLRIARTCFYTLLPALILPKNAKDLSLYLVFALVLANVSVWSVNLTRYVTMFGFLMITFFPFIALGMIPDYLCIMLPAARIPVMIILVILLAGSILFTQKFAQKKILASYGDLR